MQETELESLADHLQLQAKVNLYAWALDAGDWPALRALFCDRVLFDYSSHSGTPAAEVEADLWLGRLQNARPGFDFTQHVLSNFIAGIDGDRAWAKTYIRAEHCLGAAGPEDWVTMGGTYRFDFRREGAWKISGLQLNVIWNRGNRDIYRLAFAQS